MFVEQNARIDTRLAELEAKVDGNSRVFFWIFSIIMVAVTVPYLERLLAL